jgi:hypothetical protein
LPVSTSVVSITGGGTLIWGLCSIFTGPCLVLLSAMQPHINKINNDINDIRMSMIRPPKRAR